ncbi:MAG: hypothetical protein OXP66_03295 [Candidatus Tectomicrobia bacterium]|nr:hypothetical protein [Candidatus Tectomicrobia bacterium]
MARRQLGQAEYLLKNQQAIRKGDTAVSIKIAIWTAGLFSVRKGGSDHGDERQEKDASDMAVLGGLIEYEAHESANEPPGNAGGLVSTGRTQVHPARLVVLPAYQSSP